MASSTTFGNAELHFPVQFSTRICAHICVPIDITGTAQALWLKNRAPRFTAMIQLLLLSFFFPAIVVATKIVHKTQSHCLFFYF